jgi:hypothetical protein
MTVAGWIALAGSLMILLAILLTTKVRHGGGESSRRLAKIANPRQICHREAL